MKTMVKDPKSAQVDFSFDADVVEAFTAGDCWSLAMSIAEQTGYPIITSSFGYGYWFHVANLLPDGRVIDIMGIKSESDWFDFWVKKAHMDGRNPHIVHWTLDDFKQDFVVSHQTASFPHFSNKSSMYAQQVLALV